jgi:hypothetical protein
MGGLLFQERGSCVRVPKYAFLFTLFLKQSTAIRLQESPVEKYGIYPMAAGLTSRLTFSILLVEVSALI